MKRITPTELDQAIATMRTYFSQSDINFQSKRFVLEELLAPIPSDEGLLGITSMDTVIPPTHAYLTCTSLREQGICASKMPYLEIKPDGSAILYERFPRTTTDEQLTTLHDVWKTTPNLFREVLSGTTDHPEEYVVSPTSRAHITEWMDFINEERDILGRVVLRGDPTIIPMYKILKVELIKRSRDGPS